MFYDTLLYSSQVYGIVELSELTSQQFFDKSKATFGFSDSTKTPLISFKLQKIFEITRN